VDEAFGVNPAQRMDANVELAGVVGNDDGVRQQPLMADRPALFFWQNEIPLKNSVESRGCTYLKVTEAKLRGGSTWSRLGLPRPSR
jgi:hypothetical protein